ncbi:MAG: hypothetical protein ABSF90_26615 [Syntrophobacteraceae bacterium]|jgi:hypothetical protein
MIKFDEKQWQEIQQKMADGGSIKASYASADNTVVHLILEDGKHLEFWGGIINVSIPQATGEQGKMDIYGVNLKPARASLPWMLKYLSDVYKPEIEEIADKIMENYPSENTE